MSDSAGRTSSPGESMVEHYTRTGHTVTQALDRPWTCEDCPARSAMYEMTTPARVQTDHTGRGWVFGDEPCTYSGGCNLPIRTHFHEVVHPTAEVVVRFYDVSAPARVPSDKGSSNVAGES